LTCAYDLVKKGYKVTVFEAGEKLGGMMRTGIPEYRLPKNYLDYEISLLLKEGINVETGKELGKDVSLKDLKKRGYIALFLAIGAQKPAKIKLKGKDSDGVFYGISFLKQVNEEQPPDIGKDVVVIGGGNVAIDAARSALRTIKGGRVRIYCLESREEMPAHDWEINEAEEEGVQITNGWGPGKVLSDNGKVIGLELINCISVFDKKGNFSPRFNHKQKETITADTVILAVGQKSDLSCVASEPVQKIFRKR